MSHVMSGLRASGCAAARRNTHPYVKTPYYSGLTVIQRTLQGCCSGPMGIQCSYIYIHVCVFECACTYVRVW